MSNFFQKIFGNQVVDDQPFPQTPAHTHDGVNSPVLAPSSIDTIQIKAGAVSNIALADDSVTSDKIIDNAIMTEHLNALAVTEQKLATAAVAMDKIRNGAVSASKLVQSEAVITLSAQIGDAVIQSANIGVGAIQNANLGNAIITTAKIQDLAVEWAKIGDLAVGNSKMMNLSVSEAKIQDLAVANGKIADLAVDWGKIAALSVGNSKIMDAAISTAKIQDLAVKSAQIDDLAVTDAKIASLTAAKITAGQFNLTSTGYFSCPYGGIRIGYLGQVNGVNMYGIGAGIGHGIMLNAGGSDGYSRLWIDDSANKPLCLDCNAKDRFFIKAASGNDIVRFYGNNAWTGGFIDMLVPIRPMVRSGSTPPDPVQGEIYYDSNPGEGGTGGRLRVWNGYSWHSIAWYDDI